MNAPIKPGIAVVPGRVSLPQAPPSGRRFPLSMPLLRLSSKDVYTLEDAVKGIQVFGATGSGKSSGSMRLFAMSMLSSGFGGIVLTAKPEERRVWEHYAKITGRSNSLVIFDETKRHRFNFLEYQMRSAKTFSAHNLTIDLMRIIEASKLKQDGGSKDQYWNDAAALLLRNTITALYGAVGKVNLQAILGMIISAPTEKGQIKSDDHRNSSQCFAVLERLRTAPVNPLPGPDVDQIVQFFNQEWPGYGDRQRGGIIGTLTSSLGPFLTGFLRELFCTDTTVIPEMAHEGAILIIDLPVKVHDAAGVFAQHIWKYLFQKAAERRDGSAETARPLFLYADEAQFFVSEYDVSFQSTARSSKTVTAYACQALSTYQTMMDGKNPETSSLAFLNNLQTRIYHQNTDDKTNQAAATSIGRIWQEKTSRSLNRGKNGGASRNEGYNSGGGYSGSSNGQGGSHSSNYSSNVGISENAGWSTGESLSYDRLVEHEVLPSAFSRLTTVGRGQKTEAIITVGSRVFNATGRPWIKCRFDRE